MAQTDDLDTQLSTNATQDEWVEFEMFNPEPVKNWPYFPKELTPNLACLTVGQIVHINDTDSYYPVFYNGMKLRVQTPVLFVPFNIQTYSNKNSSLKKYSIHLCLQTHNPECKDFRDLVQRIDSWAMCAVPLPPDIYTSCIRYNYANPQLPPVMRVKIPAHGETLLIDMYDEGITVTEPHIDMLRHTFQNGCSVKAILELNNIWVAGGMFGISYKLIQLTVYQQATTGPLFR